MEDLEQQLDSFDRDERRAALAELVGRWRAGEVAMPPVGRDVNMHIHSFHSYNAYGYSPSRAAWLARRHGLAAAGILDFDVLTGLEEFREAAEMLELRWAVGMETRVFVPEFADVEINAPGEPGIAYHIGIGFPSSDLAPGLEAFRQGLQSMSQDRNRRILAKVNAYLSPVALDYDADVLPLTPSGNVTERHVCRAYQQKAECVFPDAEARARFWGQTLDVPASDVLGWDDYGLQSAVRAKTMKRGGVGYEEPDRGSFPRMRDVDRFIIDAGGIPVFNWLDGFSEGEQRMADLVDVAMDGGVRALSCIPDPRYASEKGRERDKLANLHKLAALAEERGLLLVAGTEMNIPGQAFVDRWQSPDLAPVLPLALKSACAFHAHTILQREEGRGYMSPWAEKEFPNLRDRIEYYAVAGEEMPCQL